MSLVKPVRGAQLNKNHTLSGYLFYCLLMNEGTGNRIMDYSSRKSIDEFYGSPSWLSGKFGACLSFNGANDYIDSGIKINTSQNWSITGWARIADKAPGGSLDNTQSIFGSHQLNRFYFGFRPNGNYFFGYGSAYKESTPSDEVSDDIWFQWTLVGDNGLARLYIDARQVDTLSYSGMGVQLYSNLIGARRGSASPFNPELYFQGDIDNIMLFNRALSAREIAWLYREPYAMFDNDGRARLLSFPVTIVPLAGSINAQLLLTGELNTTCKTERLEKSWLLDVLANGMTGNAFKLSTALSMSWFWMRNTGCSTLYRGMSLEEIDFTHILKTAGLDAEIISPPEFCEHETDTAYYYVLRRFNKIGHSEKTINAAVKLSLDFNGDIEKNRPNPVFTSTAEIIDGDKVQLSWFYCPLEQESQPGSFKIYFDNGSGQVDYECAIADIKYTGRKLYRFQSSSLGAGTYLFAIRAMDFNSTENNSLKQIKVQIKNTNPVSIEIIEAECV